jgi:ATP-binding cassette subfamily D (ALD) protein 4
VVFASVQVYNIAGFYSVLVPSLFYAALTSEASGSNAAATEAIDTEQLKHAVVSAAQYLSMTVVAKAVMTVLGEFMALQWRESLTLQLQSRYLRGGVFYQLAAGWPQIDNPDQRVSAEVAFWATETASLFVTASQALFNIAYYTYKTRVLLGGWFGPLMIYLYAICSLTTTKLVANPIASVTAAAEAAEGSYRRQLVELNVSAESIAMSGGATPEAVILKSDLSNLLRLRGRIVVLRFFLNLLVFFMDYAGSVVNYLILAAAVVAGVFNSHAEVIVAIAQGSGFMLMIIFGFSQIVDVSSRVSALAGYVTRIVALLDACEQADINIQLNRKEEEDAGRRIVLRPQDAASSGDGSLILLKCQGLVVGQAQNAIAGLPRRNVSINGQRASSDAIHGAEGHTPSGALTTPINLVLQSGESILVMGPSGSGKTSLLRTLRGLWCTIDPSSTNSSVADSMPLNGSVGLSDEDPVRINGAAQWQLACVPPVHVGGSGARCMFLPQAVYMLPRATLREQLAYPLSGEAIGSYGMAAHQSDDTIFSVLKELHMPVSELMSRLGGLDVCHSNWSVLLSPGQKQALAAARALLHSPSLVVLDEATSMVSTDTEQAIYTALRARGLAILSVGHRESLRALHDQVVELTPAKRV